MITVETTEDEMIVRVPRRDALAFSGLIEDGARVRAIAPNEADFRQRAAAAILHAVADLLRARPRKNRES